MRVYKTQERHPLRWVVAILIFLIVLSVTFSDVYGFWTQRPSDGTRPPTGTPGQQIQFDQPTMDSPSYTDTPPPPEVPEPATLILLGSGLAAMRLLRKKKA